MHPILPALLLGALLALSSIAAPLAAQETPPGVGGGPLVRSSGPVTVTALAVEETPQGFVGVHATVEVTVLGDGSGHVFVATKPLAQTDMQGSARLAAQVAAATLGTDWRSQDYLVSFTSGSQVIGGPSAGAVMTLALTVGLHNLQSPDDPWTLDPTVAGTGTINPDGTIGPVGGIPAKAEGAKAAGIKTFLYPAGLDQAITEVAGPFGPQQVTVEMKQHCADLGITCRPVARLEELVAAAAHVDLRVPEVPVPGTVDYAAILGPSVTAEVDDLAARIDALRATPALGSLRAADRAKVDGGLQAAEADLQAALDALGAQHYYQAATEAFQGAIQVGRAENLTAFYGGGRAESVVLAALDRCVAAVDAVAPEANVTVGDYNALYAVGAAQQRFADASALRDQAEAAHGRAATVNDWIASLEASVYCTERAATVAWWADLRHAFPAGLAVPDMEATGMQAVEDAGDLVSYAHAVLAGRPNGHLQEAVAKLQAAQSAQVEGHHPAAVVQAIEASSLASVAMQAASGGAVPDEVLDAAQQGAARAIDQARSRGIEPMLSVSLVELAQSQEGAASLQAYWTARSLAVLDVVAAASPDGRGPPGPVGGAPPSSGAALSYGGGTLMAFLGMGAVLGLAGSGLVVVALMGRRR